jgi:ATP-dependent Lon protease
VEDVKLKKKSSRKIEENNTSSEDNNEVLVQLKELLSKNPKDKSIEKCIEVYEENIKKEKEKKEKKEKKQNDKNMRIFRKIIRDKNTMNDFSFYEKLEVQNQKKLIKELREINKITRIEKPYRMTLLEADIPVEFKAAAMKKINSLRYMEPGSGEFYKIKNWVDTFMKIPFTNYQELPLSIENGVDNCHKFMENAQKTLDSAVYGLNDAKMQIMQMLGQLLTNPKAIGTAIAIHGPPGTGKTSLVKEGISKILNRPFTFIALGGATDSSFLEGHGYTYEGSTWGKIVQILIDSKCMNPVIYFDELDKISDTPRGEEITGILTHLTDTSQNSQFHDKYFAEINFDLSKCLFIFSYNDESKVNPILKDRMYRIKTKGYSGKEKTVIANNYLLPKIREQVKFNTGDIIIPDDVLSYINETHCQKEDGVRNMKRCLEIIHTKLNLYRLMKAGSNLFEGEISLKVEFPFKVTKDVVDKLIKKESDGLETWRSLYV